MGECGYFLFLLRLIFKHLRCIRSADFDHYSLYLNLLLLIA